MYVRVDLRPSRILRLARLAFHVTAMLSLLWIDLHVLLRLASAGLIAGSYLRSIRSDQSLPAAILFIDGVPRLLFADHVVEADMQAQYYCTAFLLVLHFRERQLPLRQLPLKEDAEPGSRRSFRFRRTIRKGYRILILPDSSSTRSRRQLRSLLRWNKMFVQSPQNTNGA